MTEVGAGPDPLVAALDGPQHVHHLVVAVLRAVVVDGDPDVELLDELVEARERLGGGVGRDRGDAGGLGELEDPPVGGRVGAEVVDAVGADREAEVGELALHGRDGGGI